MSNLHQEIKELREIVYELKTVITTFVAEKKIINDAINTKLIELSTQENDTRKRVDNLYKLTYMGYGVGVTVISIGGVIFAYIKYAFL